VIVLRFEGDTQEDLDDIRDEFRAAIKALTPDLNPAF
jgi:hypothetical protein